jgi:ABC-2 type transport system permease protein
MVSVLSGALLPLQFFPNEIQRVLEWLPFQAMYFSPLMMITDPHQSMEHFLSMLGVQCFWTVLTFLLTRLLYKQASKAIRIAGG